MTSYLPNRVLVTTVGNTDHLTTDGSTTVCGVTHKRSLIARTVADAGSFATCSKCRKAAGLAYMTGGRKAPEFNTGRRVFGR